jgi:transcription antitermination protein NusB
MASTRPRGDDRSDARERAMSLLYEAEQRSLTPAEVIAQQVLPLDDLTTALVGGVADNAEHLDKVIAAHATGWTLARMPALDRTVLRIASFELFHRHDVPTAVVLNEAVELAKRFSTDNSAKFVNGVLAAIVPVARPD